ncbi:MAG: hypothetical protein ACOVOR_01980 [Rhabdochlamydiaceae bacterium]
MSSPTNNFASLTFKTIITKYVALQNTLVNQVNALANSISSATPGKFILLQFQMSQVTQIGDSISNLVSQVQSVINNAVRNQKTQ